MPKEVEVDKDKTINDFFMKIIYKKKPKMLHVEGVEKKRDNYIPRQPFR